MKFLKGLSNLLTNAALVIIPLIYVGVFYHFTQTPENTMGVAKDAVAETITVTNPKALEGEVKDEVSTDAKKVLSHTDITCDELIDTWRPAHLPQGTRVQCVDGFDDETQAKVKSQGIAGLATTTRITARHYDGQTSISIRRMDHGNAAYYMDVYNHEAYHALSNSWSKEKQEAFLDFLGADAWSEKDKDYMDQPTERWAWAATSCGGAYMGGYQGYENQVPGGCKTVNEWVSK